MLASPCVDCCGMSLVHDVVFMQARNLPAADSNGASDPYVVARFGGSVAKTSIRPTTTNPIWDQTLKLHADMLPPRIAPKVRPPCSGRRSA